MVESLCGLVVLIGSLAVAAADANGGASRRAAAPGGMALVLAAAKTPNLPQSIFVTRAFRDAPKPRFASIKMKAIASDGSFSDETEYKLIESDGIVTTVRESSRTRIGGEAPDAVSDSAESTSRYVLGGLVFVQGEWKESRGLPNGGSEATTGGAETLEITRVSGRLFPLAVGNRLDLAYRIRQHPDDAPVESQMSFHVIQKIAAKTFDKRLTGPIYVIANEYREEVGEEVVAGKEEIHYAESLGWPVAFKRKEKDTSVVVEIRMIDFVPAGDG